MVKKHIDKLNSNILNYENYLNRISFDDKFKSYRNLWDKASNFELETNFPLQIEFELHNACNFRCSFCPYSFEKEKMPVNFDLPVKEKVLDYDLFKKIVDEGSENGLKAIELGYNTEPLLYKKLIPAIQYAKKKGVVDIRMTSNGSKLTKEVSKKIIDAGLTHLSVSLDAFSKETYLKMRSSKLYEEVKNNLIEFIKYRNDRKLKLPTIRVSFLETVENVHEKEDFIKFWEKKVDLLSIQSLISYKNTPDNLIKKNSIKKEIKYNCHQPWTRIVIRSNGDIKPCCTIPGMEFNLQNYKNVGIKKFWESKFMKKLRKDLKLGNGHKNKICKACIESVENKNN